MYVKTANRKLHLEIPFSSTLNRLKQEIETLEGTPISEQRIIFCGKQLLDGERTLIDYGLVNEQTTVLLLHQPNFNKTFSIDVKTIQGELRLKLLISLSDKIERIRKMINEKFRQLPAKYSLVYNGIVMCDEKTGLDYGLQENAVVYVVTQIFMEVESPNGHKMKMVIKDDRLTGEVVERLVAGRRFSNSVSSTSSSPSPSSSRPSHESSSSPLAITRSSTFATNSTKIHRSTSPAITRANTSSSNNTTTTTATTTSTATTQTTVNNDSMVECSSSPSSLSPSSTTTKNTETIQKPSEKTMFGLKRGFLNNSRPSKRMRVLTTTSPVSSVTSSSSNDPVACDNSPVVQHSTTTSASHHPKIISSRHHPHAMMTSPSIPPKFISPKTTEEDDSSFSIKKTDNNNNNNNDIDVAATTIAIPSASIVAIPSKCFKCNKKLSLTSIKCRCEHFFCPQHRYPEEHLCSFDYKARAKEDLVKQNPKISPSKVIQINRMQ